MSRIFAKWIGLLLAVALAISPSTAALATGPSADSSAPGVGTPESLGIIVKFRPGVSAERKAAVIQSLGRSRRATAMQNAELLQPAPGITQAQALEALSRSGDVLYAEPNYPVEVLAYPALPPQDIYYDQQWALGPAASYGIDAEAAWSSLAAGNVDFTESTVVAVIDTGVDLNHEDLVNRFYRDAGGNIIGYNFDPWAATTAPDDENGHGTHVAGIIAAEVDNGLGIAGIAGLTDADGTPAVLIMPVRALDYQGGGSIFDVAQAIYWAADNGADVINLSLGTTFYSTTLADAVRYAQDRGAVVVAAAGNESAPTSNVYPAALPGVVSVSATDSLGQAAYFTNYGPEVDLAAPGVEILSTYPQSDYLLLDGTSMAAPYVAGVAGLLKAANPALSAGEIIAMLTDSAVDLDGTSCAECQPGWDTYSGYGLVNAAAALTKTGINPVRWESPEPGVTIVGTTTLAVTVATPTAVEAVDIYLDTASTRASSPFLTLTNDATNPYLYSAEWTPATASPGIADGTYTLRAVARSSTGVLGEATREVQVVNATTGLTLHVVAPNGRSAGSAEVRLFQVDRSEGTPVYEEVWSGRTDLEGDLRISDWYSITMGMEYLVTVNGLVPNDDPDSPAATDGEASWFFYTQSFDTSDPNQRGYQVIDTRDAVKISPVVREGGSNVPLTDGILKVHPAGYADSDGRPLYAVAARWERGEGPAPVWVQPGVYDLVLAGNGENSYYLRLTGQELSVPLVLPFDADLAAPVTVSAQLPQGAAATVTAIYSYVDLWTTASVVGPEMETTPSNAYWLRTDNRTLKITPGTYWIVHDVMVAESLDIGGTAYWEFFWTPWDLAADADAEWVVPENGLAVTLGGTLTGQFLNTSVQPYPGGWFDANFRVFDPQGHFLLAVYNQSTGFAQPENLRLLDSAGNPVSPGFDSATADLEYTLWGNWVSAQFAAGAPTSGAHSAAVDLEVGPLAAGAVTAQSQSFTMTSPPQMPPSSTTYYPLNLTAPTPSGTGNWDWTVWLHVFEEISPGIYSLVGWQQTDATGSPTATFSSSSILLEEGKNYRVVVSGNTVTADGLGYDAVVYNRVITPCPTITLDSSTLLPVRVVHVGPDGVEWTSGAEELMLIVKEGGWSIAGAAVTIYDTAAASTPNLYIDPGTYDLFTTAWVQDATTYEVLYTTTGTMKDVAVDTNTTELRFDLTNAPAIQLSTNPAEYDDLTFWANLQGTNFTSGWSGEFIGLPMYYSPGTYEMSIEFDAADVAGQFPEGDWSYDLLPAEAAADGTITLQAGDGLRTWGVGGGFTGAVSIGGATSFFPNDSLTVSAQFTDAYGNRIDRVSVGDEGGPIWYDAVGVAGAAPAGATVNVAPVRRADASAPVQLHTGSGSDSVQTEFYPGWDTTPLWPVLTVLGPNGEELVRSTDGSYRQDLAWTLPTNAVGGTYTARYGLQVAGNQVLEAVQTFTVNPMVTAEFSISGTGTADALTGTQDLVISGMARSTATAGGVAGRVRVSVSDGTTATPLTKDVTLEADTDGDGLSAYSEVFTAGELGNLSDGTLTVTVTAQVDGNTYEAREYVAKAYAGGSISGTVYLPARDAATGNGGITVSLPRLALSTTTAGDGSFAFPDVPPGTHDLLIGYPGHLAERLPVTVSGGQVTTVEPIVLRGGDASGDNGVSLIDLARLALAYGATQADPDYDPAADFNEDGRISLADLVILAENYGQNGADLSDLQ